MVTSFEKAVWEEELLKPYRHIVPVRSGETVYTLFPQAFQYWLKIPKDKLQKIQKITELFVHFTYLFDDIQDRSLYRRNVPAAHCVYGVPVTINTTLYVYGLALQKTLELGYPEAVNVALTQIMDVILGQGIDVANREKSTVPTEEEYIKLAEKKCSAMLLLSLQLMQLFSTNKTDYSKVIKLFGVYYVIRDDYCNLLKPEGLEGLARNDELQSIKETHFCEDLTDGKYSWPVVHALKSPEGSVISYLLKQHTRDMSIKNLFLETLNRLGSLQYTRDVLRHYERQISEELVRLGGNPALETILNDFMIADN